MIIASASNDTIEYIIENNYLTNTDINSMKVYMSKHTPFKSMDEVIMCYLWYSTTCYLYQKEMGSNIQEIIEEQVRDYQTLKNIELDKRLANILLCGWLMIDTRTQIAEQFSHRVYGIDESFSGYREYIRRNVEYTWVFECSGEIIKLSSLPEELENMMCNESRFYRDRQFTLKKRYERKRSSLYHMVVYITIDSEDASLIEDICYSAKHSSDEIVRKLREEFSNVNVSTLEISENSSDENEKSLVSAINQQSEMFGVFPQDGGKTIVLLNRGTVCKDQEMDIQIEYSTQQKNAILSWIYARYASIVSAAAA